MPIKKSPNHPKRGGFYEYPKEGKAPPKGQKPPQRTLIISKIARKVLKLINEHDRYISTLENIWRTNNPYPITTSTFHSKISNHRCEVYRFVILLMLCNVRKDGANLVCADECVESEKYTGTKRKKVKKDPDA